MSGTAHRPAPFPAAPFVPQAPAARTWRPTARWRLTLTYALFLVVAGACTLTIIYLALRFIPSYPLTAANPRESPVVATRGQILDTLLRASGYALLLLAVIGLTGGWLIAGRVLSPLRAITRAANRAAEGSLEHRIALPGRRDEFTDLSDAFDHMLGRLQQSFESQQRFAANASHELRTPLAITHTMLDVAAADPDGQDYRQLVSRLRETNRRGIEIVDALLELATLGHVRPDTEPVDLADTTAEAVALVAEEAGTHGIAVHSRYGPAPVSGNPVLLRQMTVNLLQNALRHNLTTGGSVTVTVGVDPDDRGRFLLTISNTGPVLPGSIGSFTEPFLRGEGRTAASGSERRGHGLGLSIVASIVSVHEGELHLAANPEGGLTARVSLPARAGR
ncbi:two-component sensor histidine kinase [Streptomyces camponoticapitis]|uniref:histidine kinase n=1 Tax=Streptomyces camponoticapitis TaxID=1616125 RepID=A0ABQ2E3T6_9ACTN|nr:HAMP domain-containing sensor histidine kinase [Streptomyces camponoticapitis]GGJ93877.1 two-component sensor histidine kinase [Streptomyces camponoticapitis]